MNALVEPTAQIMDSTDLKDGLENLIASMGGGKDKRSQSSFTNKKQLSRDGAQEELNALYETDWVAGKTVDIIPEDMTREWRSFTGEMDPKTVELLVDEEDRLGLQTAFQEAHKWARLYGTAFIIMSVDDGLDPEDPLDVDFMSKGELKHIKVVDRHRLQKSDTVETNPMEANFGMPDWYRLTETTVKIHHTRVLRFDGVKLPYDQFRRNGYWSNSVLDRLYDPITNFNIANDGSASMIFNANVDVMKIKGLMGYLQTAAGEELLRKRFAMASLMKSFNNMLLLDNEEDYQVKTNSFSGLPDLIDRFAKMLSAATDIPATRFLGTSASGLNATGEGDLKNYYDTIRSQQKFKYKPLLDYFDKIMAKSLGLSDDEDLKYEFNSLFQMSDAEQSVVDLNNAQRDTIYLDQDVVTPEIVAKELKEKKTYTNIDDDHIEELEEDEPDDLVPTTPVGETADPEQQEAEGEAGGSGTVTEET